MVKAKSTSMNYSAVTCQERRSYCFDGECVYCSGYAGVSTINRSFEGSGGFNDCYLSVANQQTEAAAW